MKKKKFALLSLAVVAGLSLASCTDNGGKTSSPTTTPSTQTPSTPTSTQTPSTPTSTQTPSVTTSTPGSTTPTKAPVKDLGRLDIHISYSGKQGVSIVGDSFYNTVENVNYTKGALLPTWKALGELTGTTVKDASSYSDDTDDKTYNTVKTNGYKSQTDSSQMIDLYYSTVKNINTMGGADQAVDLLKHLDKMPNFAAWLKKNPTMKRAIMSGTSIYYTPYFDGYQDVERMFVMDTNLAKAVLDTEDYTLGTTKNGKGADANGLQAAAYQPVINADYNYAADQKVSVLKDGKVVEITIKKTENIIKQQNALLANGCTGAELAQQFKTYLNNAFGEYIGKGEGKIFENLSDIFISESAAYNSDELIALMRVVKANPGVISGDANVEIEGLCPRGVANNRVDNIADFMQIWGIQGMTSKKDMLYFNSNGQLLDAATTKQTYDGIQNLSALYDEGLILANFWDSSSKLGGTGYLNKYFAKTVDNGGYGFMLYDYAASTGASNTKVDGIGTDPSKLVEGYKEVNGVRAILPPLAYWATGEGFDSQNQELRDLTGKELLRYSEENRSLKNNAWCIPTSTDNLDAALAMMDALFTVEGTRIQDFGPNNGKYWTLGVIAGEEAPIMTSAVKEMIGSSGTDFWTFMRSYIGSTHGVGHVRSTAIQIQSCNAYAQVGLNNLENAIAAGVVVANRVDKNPDVNDSGYTWDTTAPTAGYENVTQENANQYDALTSFWNSDKCAASANGWVAIVAAKYGEFSNTTVIGKTKNTNVDYTYADVLGQISKKNTIYLYTMASSLGGAAIPGFLQK